jgi:putative Mn2+ efflux pump MntP
MSGVDFWSVLVIAISLSADCFAVALGASISQKTLPFLRFWRLPVLFGLFQSIMCVLGWLAGRSIVDFISAFDHWIAFGLLLIIGVRMIWESFHESDKEKKQKNLSSWPVLLLLAIATSIDSLAAGLSFGFLAASITAAAVTIGVTSLVITAVGILLGKKVGALVGERAEMVGGIVLIIIGVRILLEHLL